MFPIPWYSIILVSIPQTILAVKLGFEMFGFQVKIKNYLLISALAGIITYFLRQCSFFPGIHSIILIITVAFLVTALEKIYIWHSIASSLLGYMVLGVIEGVCLPTFLYLTTSTIVDLIANPWLNILSFLPILLTALVLYVFVRNEKFVVYNLGKQRTME